MTRSESVVPVASLRRLFALALIAAGALAGCGSDEPTPITRFESALASIGGGGAVAGAGYGYVDVGAISGAPSSRSTLSWAADALGPGASDLLTHDRAVRGTGVDASSADRIVSIAGSYAIGARLDGIDTGRVAAALQRLGAARRDRGDWAAYDLGAERQTPIGTPLEPLGVLASRSATSADALALARSDLGLDDLIGKGSPVTDSPAILAATGCLGDVLAARIQLDNFTYLPGIGPDMNAVGVTPGEDGARREILCAIDPDPAEIDRTATALRRALPGPGARDVARATVEVEDSHGQHVARAVLELTPAAEPGFLFRALTTNDLLALEGLRSLDLDPGGG